MKRRNLYGRMADLALELRQDREKEEEKEKLQRKIETIRRKINLLQQ